MTPRELVKATLEFCNPERIPRDLWVLPWANNHYPGVSNAISSEFPMDLVGAPSYLAETLPGSGDQYEVGSSVDEWGCERINIHKGVIGEVKNPQIEDWATDLDKIVFPRALLTIDKGRIDSFCRSTDHFVRGSVCLKPFERLQYLRGSEDLYMDLAEEPEELGIFISRLHSFYLEQLELWCRTDVDSIDLMDDWGSQTRLLISPAMWRKVFKPLYRDYCEMAHSHGKYVFMHSDGHIAEIYADLIEVGVDALNSQLFSMDIEELGKSFAGKITFWGEIDRQHLLPHGCEEDIRNAVNRVFRACYRNGGVIAQCEFGPAANPDNVRTVFDAWEKVLL